MSTSDIKQWQKEMQKRYLLKYVYKKNAFYDKRKQEKREREDKKIGRASCRERV